MNYRIGKIFQENDNRRDTLVTIDLNCNVISHASIIFKRRSRRQNNMIHIITIFRC